MVVCRANVAAAAGGIIFFILYLPYSFMVVWEETLQSTTKILSVIILVILVILNYIAADYIDENDRIYIFEIEGKKTFFFIREQSLCHEVKLKSRDLFNLMKYQSIQHWVKDDSLSLWQRLNSFLLISRGISVFDLEYWIRVWLRLFLPLRGIRYRSTVGERVGQPAPGRLLLSGRMHGNAPHRLRSLRNTYLVNLFSLVIR